MLWSFSPGSPAIYRTKTKFSNHYYGHYASRVRGMRRKAGNNDAMTTPVMVEPEPEAVREAKRRLANLLRRILEVERLRCLRCGETTMRIVSFITEPKTIDKIPEHLRCTQTSRRRQRAPPRRWRSAAGTAPA